MNQTWLMASRHARRRNADMTGVLLMTTSNMPASGFDDLGPAARQVDVDMTRDEA